MATVIQIKRSGVAGSPAELAQGELAYSYLADNGSNGGDRLYIGTGTETDGVAADIEVIGGIYFTSKYPSTFGSVEASKLLSTDSNSAINTLNIGNSTTVGGTLKLNEGTNNGSHFIAIKAPNAVTADTTLTLPDGVGSNGQVLTTDGSTGALSWSTISSTIQLAADSGSPDTFTTGNTLTFTGGTGIDTTVSDDTITIAVDATIATASSTTTFTNKTFDANGTGNSITNIEVADLASGVLDTDLSTVSASDDTLASAKAIKAYVDAQTSAIDVDIAGDTGTGAITDAETLTFTGGEGIDTSVSDNTVTISAEDASDTNKGIASFDATDFTVSSGDVTLNAERVQDIAGTMFSSNTETLITATYQDADGTIDLVVDNDLSNYDNTTSGFITASSSETLTNKTINASQLVNGSVTNAKLANSSVSFTDESSTAGSVSLGGTLEFLTGEGINTTASGNTLTIAAEDASTSNKGVASFDTNDFTVSSGAVSIKSGSIENGDLAGSIANAKLTNSTITVAGDSGSNAVDLGDTLTVQGTTNEIETSVSGDTITVGLPDDVTVGNNLTVTGNLTVNGTTTTLATTNSTVSDTLIELGNGTTGTPGNDSGIVIERGDADNAFIGFDESADKFIVGTGSFTGASTGNLTISTGTIVANLEATTATLGGSNVTTTDNTQTLTNKTIDASSNTLSNIGNSSLTNSAISFTDESSTAGSVSLGGTLEFLTGEGIDTTASGSTITIAAELATTSNKGVASFSSDNFTVTSGAVTVTTIDGGTF